MTYEFKNVDFNSLNNEDFQPERPTIYSIFWDNLKFDVLINYRKSCDKAVVFGTGAVGKDKTEYPVFSRSTWMNDIPYTGIWYFDTSLYIHDDINLAWGYGTKNRWVLENIAFILFKILSKQNVLCENTLFFGSSGGYTSIALATMLRSKACVFNPQLMIENYYKTYIAKFKNVVLKKSEDNLIDSRTSVVKHFLREGYVPDIALYVNSQSYNDTYMQVIPFLKEMADNKLKFGDNVKLNYYFSDGGHNGMPGKKESIDIINDLMLNHIKGKKYSNEKLYRIDRFLDRVNKGYNPKSLENENETIK